MSVSTVWKVIGGAVFVMVNQAAVAQAYQGWTQPGQWARGAQQQPNRAWHQHQRPETGYGMRRGYPGDAPGAQQGYPPKAPRWGRNVPPPQQAYGPSTGWMHPGFPYPTTRGQRYRMPGMILPSGVWPQYHRDQRQQGMGGMSGMQDQQGMGGMSGMSGMQGQQGMGGMSGMQDQQGMESVSGLPEKSSRADVPAPLGGMSGRYRKDAEGNIYLYPNEQSAEE